MVQQDSLLHGETLLVVTASNLKDVTLEFLTQSVSLDFLGDALVVEDAQFTLVGDFNEFLTTSGRIGNVNLENRKKEDGLMGGWWINLRYLHVVLKGAW